ncbi:hypothetical protein CR513_59618, partial [Mucuna pruriens]
MILRKSTFLLFVLSLTRVEAEVRQVIRRCGQRVNVVNYDRVLKLFFHFPVWRWPAQDPLFHCATCKRFLPYSYSLPPTSAAPESPSPSLPDSAPSQL